MAMRPRFSAWLVLCAAGACSDHSIVVGDRVRAVDAGPAPEAAAPNDAGPDAASACNTCTLDQICIDGACKPKGALTAVTLNACAQAPCINVYNNCPIPLFIHPVTDGTVIIDQGRITPLATGEQIQ
jgi:hypothetical protein